MDTSGLRSRIEAGKLACLTVDNESANGDAHDEVRDELWGHRVPLNARSGAEQRRHSTSNSLQPLTPSYKYKNNSYWYFIPTSCVLATLLLSTLYMLQVEQAQVRTGAGHVSALSQQPVTDCS